MPTTQETEAGSSFKIPIPSPRSSAGGQILPDSSATSSQSTSKSSPKEEVPDRADAELQPEDSPQEVAELEGVRQEDDLDDSNPFKDEIDSSPSPIQAASDVSKVLCSLPLNSSGRPKSDRNRQVPVGLSYSEYSPQAVNLKEEFSEVSSNSSGTPSTGLPSLFTNDSQEPLLQGRDDSYVDGNDIKKTKRSPLRAKYAVQQANFVIPVVSAAVIAIYTIAYATSVYLQDKGSLIAFIINNPKFTTVPGLIALSLFAIGIFCAIKQFNNTIEHQIDEKDPDKILKKVLKPETEGQILRHLAVVHSNGTILHYRFNTWEANKNGIANVDEEVIRKVSKIESVINDRPVFTALSTGFIVANLALPLWLYAAGGISNVTTFYQSILATNTGLLSLVATGMFVLSILYLGVCNYNKQAVQMLFILKIAKQATKKLMTTYLMK